jgi:hypothetical protein
MTLPFNRGPAKCQTHRILEPRQPGWHVTIRSTYDLQFREHETSASTDTRQYNNY